MAGTSATHAITPGARVTVELSGAMGTGYRDEVFKTNLVVYLQMQGLNVESVLVTSEYGIGARAYKAQVIVRTQAPSNVSSLIAAVSTAAEQAGSYTPAVSIPSMGQAPQPNVKPGLTGSLIDSVGDAVEGISDVPRALFSGINVIVVGLVVIVAVIAFGPNVKDVARAVR
jgi:hypothetical protein